MALVPLIFGTLFLPGLLTMYVFIEGASEVHTEQLTMVYS